MALDVFNDLEDSYVKEAIDEHPDAFLLGSNGPDILFYYNVFPWQDQKLNRVISNYGNEVHEKHINDFYNYSLDFIKNLKNERRKTILISFLAGHLLHWSLDVNAHPFIFYRSGPLEGKTKYWHSRYESMIDALMITYVKRKDMSKVNVQKFVNVSEEEKIFISSFYQQVLADVFGIYIKPEVVSSAITSFKSVLKFLYDPHNVYTPLIEKLELKLAKPWAFSSHIVNSKIDSKYDVLNLKRDIWSNPTDLMDMSTASFVDLYNHSIDEGLKLLEELDNALLGSRNDFDDLLEDRQYTTGRKTGIKMKYYDSIYE